MAVKTPVIKQYEIPRTRPEQFEEWPGDIVAPLPKGEYLQVRRLGHTHTANEACFDVWHALNGEAQKLSAAGYSQTPTTGRDLVGNVIDAINRSMGVVNARVVTHANAMYSSVFGGPLPYAFELWPIRWPGESPDALKWVLKFVEAAFQVPQVKSNTADWGIVSNHASIIMMPLLRLKQNIMQTLFGIEPKGAISPGELDAMFRNSNLQPPLGSSFDDVNDTPADTAKEDADAMKNESAQKPDEATITAAQAGVEVWTFVPDAANWATFAELQRRKEADGPSQSPLTPFPFTTGTIGEGNGEGNAGSGTPAGLVTQ